MEIFLLSDARASFSPWKMKPPLGVHREALLRPAEMRLGRRRLARPLDLRKLGFQPEQLIFHRAVQIFSKPGSSESKVNVTAVGFEPTPLRNGALSHRFRPLGQTVMLPLADLQYTKDVENPILLISCALVLNCLLLLAAYSLRSMCCCCFIRPRQSGDEVALAAHVIALAPPLHPARIEHN